MRILSRGSLVISPTTPPPRPRSARSDDAPVEDEPAPAGFRLTADSGTRLVANGSVLAGGSPVRVLRLTPAGARQVAGWLTGAPVPDNLTARKLARRMLDAGIAHPVFAPADAPDPASAPATHAAPDKTDRSSPRRGQFYPRSPFRHRRRASAPGSALPSASVAASGRALQPGDVTVVIPVRDRHAELGRCLGGLHEAAVTLGDGAPSVIVVDDCSADAGAIGAIAAGGGARVIRRPVNGGPGAARNTGLAAATTELVAFLDSDCVPRAGWLEPLLAHFADPAIGAVAPRIVPHEEGTGWLARYEGASSTLDMGERPSIVRPGARVSYVPGAALVVRRSAAGDGFTEGMYVGEDVDFVWRMAAAGWRVRYEPAALMGHDHRVRLRAWFSRRADYGTSAAALEQLHPGAVRPLRVSWWTAGAWAAALSRRPLAAAALTGTATALLARRLAPITGERGPGAAWSLAARLAGGGTLAAARPLGSALSRTWWPLALPVAIAVPKLRVPVAALILAPPLLDWADRRPPLDPARYAAARLLDDAAYSVGVWHGCLRRRTIAPLLPLIGVTRPSGMRETRSPSRAWTNFPVPIHRPVNQFALPRWLSMSASRRLSAAARKGRPKQARS
jgi:mycofactocin glycosyltransferase